ncbi:MAG: histidine kinase, partial [Candidatus Cryptobacteroides sp.]
MKKGRLIKEWLGITLETYLLYNLLWFSIDYRDFHWDYLIDSLDVAYCVLFAFSSIVIMHLSLKKTLRNNKLSPHRVFLNGLMTFLLNILLAISFEIISNTYVWPAEGKDFWFSTYIMCIVASFVSIVHLLYHYTEIIKRQSEENISLTKSNLKAQLDPHFVFNSLSILAGLVEENPKRAEQFIISFSRIYRNLIYNLSNDTIPVSDAIRLAKDYFAIMRERFLSAIDLVIEDFHIKKGEEILTMATQVLIENAIMHNRPSPEFPLV